MPTSLKLPLPLLLAMLTAIAPLAIDMYLPAMGQMAATLNSDIHHVELSVSTFLLGFALGQITGGPVSDRLGRKPVILTGLTIFAVASALLTFSTSLDSLLIFRALQAFGGGLAVVNATAIVRDMFDGRDIAKVLSMVAMIMMAAPLFAPMLGSLILHMAHWQAIFAVLGIYCVLVTALLVWQLPESHPKLQRVKRHPLAGYLQVIRHRPARRYILTLASAYSGMFVFITASPYLYLEYFGASEATFPWLFGANVIVLMVMNRCNMLLLNRFSPVQILTAGIALHVLSALALLSISMVPSLFVLPVVLPLMMVFVGALGLITANTMGTVMQHFRDVAGSATALMGVIQFSGGALAGLLWAHLHDNTPVPMMAVMVLTSGLSALALFSARHADREYATD